MNEKQIVFTANQKEELQKVITPEQINKYENFITLAVNPTRIGKPEELTDNKMDLVVGGIDPDVRKIVFGMAKMTFGVTLIGSAVYQMLTSKNSDPKQKESKK